MLAFDGHYDETHVRTPRPLRQGRRKCDGAIWRAFVSASAKTEPIKHMVEQARPAAAPERELPSYGKPPVTEVVAGVHFENPLQNFSIAHVGLFWTRIQKEFPTSQHAIPVSPPGGDLRWVDSSTGLPLPRVWFVSEGKDDLVQLQNDCFFFNWRRTSDAGKYPRYEHVIGGFTKQLDTFEAFLKETGFQVPKPLLCELTYVNHIPRGDAWKSIDDIEGIFKDFCWSKDKKLLQTPRSLAWSCSFGLPEKAGTMLAKMSQVVRLDEQGQALRLELSCKGLGRVSSLSTMRPWFDLAHEWIVRGFADLTTRDAQAKLWEKEND